MGRVWAFGQSKNFPGRRTIVNKGPELGPSGSGENQGELFPRKDLWVVKA